jgi:DNA-binding response OmpR family regulator
LAEDAGRPPDGPQGRSGGAEGLAGCRVLVVEDEFLVALALGDDLRDIGCIVLGPYHDLKSARGGLDGAAFDLAVLDVNLNGVEVFPLADELERRRVPFLFLTGYGALNLPERYRRRTRVAKPYQFEQLQAAMRGLLASPPTTVAPRDDFPRGSEA